jgi:hypothetical protein
MSMRPVSKLLWLVSASRITGAGLIACQLVGACTYEGGGVEGAAVALDRLFADHIAGGIGEHAEEVGAWAIEGHLQGVGIDDRDALQVGPFAGDDLFNAHDTVEVVGCHRRGGLRRQRALPRVLDVVSRNAPAVCELRLRPNRERVGLTIRAEIPFRSKGRFGKVRLVEANQRLSDMGEQLGRHNILHLCGIERRGLEDEGDSQRIARAARSGRRAGLPARGTACSTARLTHRTSGE